jgi:hypothetical protein
MTCELLKLERNSLFEATLAYKDSNNVPVDLSGSASNADFTIHDGQGTNLWVGSVTTGEITADYPNGSFVLLIPEVDVDDFDFDRAKYRFRIDWITKGWQSVADGDVIFDDAPRSRAGSSRSRTSARCSGRRPASARCSEGSRPPTLGSPAGPCGSRDTFMQGPGPGLAPGFRQGYARKP